MLVQQNKDLVTSEYMSNRLPEYSESNHSDEVRSYSDEMHSHYSGQSFQQLSQRSGLSPEMKIVRQDVQMPDIMYQIPDYACPSENFKMFKQHLLIAVKLQSSTNPQGVANRQPDNIDKFLKKTNSATSPTSSASHNRVTLLSPARSSSKTVILKTARHHLSRKILQ